MNNEVKNQRNQSMTDGVKVLVIGAGFGRTGTKSLKMVLENLGFKCYHMQETCKNFLATRALWSELHAMNTARRMSSGIWDRVFGDGYSACVDFPTTCYWSEIMQYYEWKTGLKAKVILTERDSAEQWYQSAKESIFPVSNLANALGIDRFVGHWRCFIQGQFSGKLNNKEECMAEYRNHNAYVKRVVPSDQLLVLNLKRDSADGYRRLIDFLEVSDQNIIREFQDQPLPRVHSKERFRIASVAVRTAWMIIFAVIGILVSWVAWFVYSLVIPVRHSETLNK